ncbi:MAG: S1/P1 nuclease [Terriglobales bacterium]
MAINPWSKQLAVSLLIAFLVPQQAAWGWGNEGHIYVNRVAAEKLPLDTPAFLRSSVAELAYLGPEPDRWRESSNPALKSAQEPDHYIDLERIAWLDPLPEGRYEFYQKLYEKRAQTKDNPDDYLPERVGLQPYIVMEIFGRLKSAFREYRQLRDRHQPTEFIEHKIVFYAGWLGHYVADGSQPLHTTIHYNGWVGANPKRYETRGGIHAEFETAYVSRNIVATDFAHMVHAPEHMANPFGSYIQYLRNSNKLVERVYELDKAGGFRDAGSREAFDFTAQRLAAGSQMLVNMWYTAWLDSAD